LNINTRDCIIILDFLDGSRDYVKYTRGSRPFDLKVSNLKVRAKCTSQRGCGLLFNLIKGSQSFPILSLSLWLSLSLSLSSCIHVWNWDTTSFANARLSGVRISGSRNYINFFRDIVSFHVKGNRDFFLLTVYLGLDEVRQSGIIIIIRM